MDQDSYWENFSLYRSYIEQENHLNTNVGIWGPCVVDKATGLTNREEYPDHVITSGAVYKVKDLKKLENLMRIILLMPLMKKYV